MMKRPRAQPGSVAAALKQLQAKLGSYTGTMPEIRFAHCPKCGASPSNPTFAVNLEKHCFKCHRASCGYKGHLAEIIAVDLASQADLQASNEEASQIARSNADRAAALWNSSSPITKASSTVNYLASRGIGYHTIRHLPIREFDGGSAVIGMANRQGRLRAVNYSIAIGDGYQKRYEGAKKNAFSVLKESERIIVAEGTVTGLSVLQHLAKTGYGLIVAGDAANLSALADPCNKWVLAGKREVILAADNDLNFVGRNAAMRVYSAFPEICRIKMPSRPGSDWNDCLTSGQWEDEWNRG